MLKTTTKVSVLSVYFCSFNMFTQGPLKLKIILDLLYHKNLARIKVVVLQTSEARKTVIFHARKTPLKGCHIM